MKCLITGFAPMFGRGSNISWDVAQAVCRTSLPCCELTAELLPVSFRRAPEILRQSVDRLSPDVVVMLGEYASGGCIKLERIAVNMMDASNADSDSFRPDAESIDSSLPAAYFSALPLKTIRDTVAGENIAVKISNSCGLYVCNRVYFEALRLCTEGYSDLKTLFVHIPREGMSLNDCTKAVQTILIFLNRYEPNK